MAIVGVIPAAGHATRLQPLDRSKEVYPIRGRPVMDFLIERMRAGRGLEREREPGVYFDSLCDRGVVGGLRLAGTYLDIGTRQALREALGAGRERGR